MNIRDIQWPIYALGSDVETYEDMNVLYVEHSGTVSILDNKNLSGSTLGARRLREQEENLYKFKRTLFMLSELIEYTRPKKIIDRKFIDNTGNLFTYNKTEYKKLIWRKVKKVTRFSTYVIIMVEGMLQNFEIPNNYWNRFNDLDLVYLGLLDFGTYYLLYDISTEYIKDTRRKV